MARRLIDLGGSDWQFGSALPRPWGRVEDLDAVSEWLRATVPGNVHADLLAQGCIADPFLGTSNETCRWVNNRDWWYRRTIELELGEGERVFLIAEGIDYLSQVTWDGITLGCHEGMFSQQVYDVTRLVHQAVHHTLAVRLWGAHAFRKYRLSLGDRLWQPIATLLQGTLAFPNRMATVKCQMSFGWDFAPELPTVGIWDDIALVITGSALIADVFVQPRLAGDHANVTVQLELDSDCEQRVRTVLTVRGKNFDTAEQRFTFDLDLVSGLQMREVAFRLDSPRLWNPWDRGDPNLYTLEVTLIGSSPIDSLTVPCGIRSIELSSDDGGPPWIFVVNGVREFIRGLNWVPADALPGRLRRDDYAALIAMAKSASVNLLRVWGGGLREKRDFYDLCDEAGILVWQEFPFACAFLDHLPRDRDFIDLARRECEAIVRAVRNHPSIVLWCGGNEFSPRRNRELVEAIREAVAANDPDGRPFKPASPDEGESHNWRVWHGFANVRDYRRDETRFASEFGLQAAPAVESLQRFLSLLDLYPPGHAWEYHRAGIKKLLRYAESLRSSSTHDLSGFVAATQKAQAYGLQVAIEHFRRRKYRTGGAIVWQFNEPWPAISWAIVDFYRRPKLAYEKLGELFNPVLVSLDYAVVLPRADDMPEAEVSVINSLMRSSGLPRIPCRCDCRADVWAINDLTRSFDGCGLHISLDDREVHRQTLSLPADSRQRVGAFTCTCSLGGGPNLLRVELRQGDAIISTNSYDLSWCDLGEAGWFNKLYWAVFDRVLR